jgi:hypothetical protein
VFQIDEEGLKAGILRQLDNVCMGGGFDAKRFTHLIGCRCLEEIVRVHCQFYVGPLAAETSEIES